MQEDTIKLLRECDAGIKMGVDALESVYDKVTHEDLKSHLDDQIKAHNEMKKEIQEELEHYGEEGKEPNPMVKGMSHVKTQVKLGFDCSDETIAALLTDGCNMGVKSLARYLNKYSEADAGAKNVAKKLISLEETMAKELRPYL